MTTEEHLSVCVCVTLFCLCVCVCVFVAGCIIQQTLTETLAAAETTARRWVSLSVNCCSFTFWVWLRISTNRRGHTVEMGKERKGHCCWAECSASRCHFPSRFSNIKYLIMPRHGYFNFIFSQIHFSPVNYFFSQLLVCSYSCPFAWLLTAVCSLLFCPLMLISKMSRTCRGNAISISYAFTSLLAVTSIEIDFCLIKELSTDLFIDARNKSLRLVKSIPKYTEKNRYSEINSMRCQKLS